MHRQWTWVWVRILILYTLPAPEHPTGSMSAKGPHQPPLAEGTVAWELLMKTQHGIIVVPNAGAPTLPASLVMVTRWTGAPHPVTWGHTCPPSACLSQLPVLLRIVRQMLIMLPVIG